MRLREAIEPENLPYTAEGLGDEPIGPKKSPEISTVVPPVVGMTFRPKPESPRRLFAGSYKIIGGV
jgi:hypothetical protein